MKIWRRIFVEAGYLIPDCNVERMVRDTYVRALLTDTRRLDLISNGIAGVFSGACLFLDVTCVSPLTGRGEAVARASLVNSAALGRQDYRTWAVDYPDVANTPSAALLSLSFETYGRWGPHSFILLRQLARAKANNVSLILQASTRQAYMARWSSLLSIGLQRLVASAISSWRAANLVMQFPQETPWILDVLDYSR